MTAFFNNFIICFIFVLVLLINSWYILNDCTKYSIYVYIAGDSWFKYLWILLHQETATGSFDSILPYEKLY